MGNETYTSDGPLLVNNPESHSFPVPKKNSESNYAND